MHSVAIVSVLAHIWASNAFGYNKHIQGLILSFTSSDNAIDKPPEIDKLFHCKFSQDVQTLFYLAFLSEIADKKGCAERRIWVHPWEICCVHIFQDHVRFGNHSKDIQYFPLFAYFGNKYSLAPHFICLTHLPLALLWSGARAHARLARAQYSMHATPGI
mgnify:CR=1 FL=1